MKRTKGGVPTPPPWSMGLPEGGQTPPMVMLTFELLGRRPSRRCVPTMVGRAAENFVCIFFIFCYVLYDFCDEL